MTGTLDDSVGATGMTDEMSGRPDAPRQATARQLQIYRAAAKLFVEKGFAGASMSDIAEAVQLTKAGLYHFVSSKEDLLFDIMQHGMNRLEHDVVEPALKEPDPLARLQLIIRKHIRNVVGADPDAGHPISIIMDEPQGLAVGRRRLINERKRLYMNLIRDTLKALQDRGDMSRDLDPTIAAFNIIGTIMWVPRWRRPGGRLSLDEISREIVSNLVTGLVSPTASVASTSNTRGEAPAPGPSFFAVHPRKAR